MNSNPFDRLLEWCSVVGGGSRQQFKRASSDILHGLEPSRALSALEQMGHLEVDWEGTGRWSTNPPVLALLEGSGGNACLVGARTGATWAELANLRDEGRVTALTRIENQAPYPSSWFIGVRSTAELQSHAALIGAVAVADPARAQLPGIGALDQILSASAKEYVPSGFGAEMLDVSTLRFQPADVRYGRWPPGCFRQHSRGRDIFLFIDDAGRCSVTDRWVATQAELRRVRRTGTPVPDILRWDRASLRMACYASAQLPTQWSRAAALCSGLPPVRVRVNPWSDVYAGVRPTMYRYFCKALEIPPRSSDLSHLKEAN